MYPTSIINRFINAVKRRFYVAYEGAVLLSKLKRSRKRSFILFGSPIHGNLGDHAISMAEREYLAAAFSEVPCYEVSRNAFIAFKKPICKAVKQDDVLLITGGGFLGDLWIEENIFVKRIIESFPENKIVVLPQTAFYQNKEIKDQDGEFLKEHSNLFLFARETQTYNLLCEMYDSSKVFLVPDIVLSLSYTEDSWENRKDIYLCLRKDKEKIINQQRVKEIIKTAIEENDTIREIDTNINRVIFFEKRTQFVLKKLSEFSKAKLVVTDRLHGMVFSVITGTPCIAFDNLSKKVSGVYQWISDLDSIGLADDTERVQHISQAPKPFLYNPQKTQNQLQKLKEVLSVCINE